MGEFLNTLKQGSPFYRVEAEIDGFSLVRTGADSHQFDATVRDLVDHGGQSYIAFPVMDPRRRSGYDRVFILPMD